MDLSEFSLSNIDSYVTLFAEHGPTYLIKFVTAFLIFWIGKRIARWVTNMVVAGMRKNDVDSELQGFFNSLIYWVLFTLVCITALGQLGVQTASFVAILGAAV